VNWLPVAEGQPVQYWVLTIDHMPLYQSGIAGRVCRKRFCRLVRIVWYAFVFVDGVRLSYCVRLNEA
jgi:hypothetical protein